MTGNIVAAVAALVMVGVILRMRARYRLDHPGRATTGFSVIVVVLAVIVLVEIVLIITG